MNSLVDSLLQVVCKDKEGIGYMKVATIKSRWTKKIRILIRLASCVRVLYAFLLLTFSSKKYKINFLKIEHLHRIERMYLVGLTIRKKDRWVQYRKPGALGGVLGEKMRGNCHAEKAGRSAIPGVAYRNYRLPWCVALSFQLVFRCWTPLCSSFTWS